MQTYCLIKICKSQAALYQNLTSKSRSWRILNTENPTRIQPHPMQATLRHRLLSLDPSHQRRKSMSGSSYDCPKQWFVQISDFKLKSSNPNLCQNWWFEHFWLWLCNYVSDVNQCLFRKKTWQGQKVIELFAFVLMIAKMWRVCKRLAMRSAMFPIGREAKQSTGPTWNKMPEPRPCTWDHDAPIGASLEEVSLDFQVLFNWCSVPGQTRHNQWPYMVWCNGLWTDLWPKKNRKNRFIRR